jgi:hypothetical protein
MSISPGRSRTAMPAAAAAAAAAAVMHSKSRLLLCQPLLVTMPHRDGTCANCGLRLTLTATISSAPM